MKREKIKYKLSSDDLLLFFFDDISNTVYFDDSDNINFGIDKVGIDALAEYIRTNGRTEIR